jgi:AcrR family transcriptional regulator
MSSGQTSSAIRDRILDVTIDLIERVGLEQFSMRRLSQELGNAPMAVYRHFDSRQALLEDAADRLLARARIPEPSEGPWQDRMMTLAISVWESVTAHPWVHLVLEPAHMREPQVRQTRAIHDMLREAGLSGPDLRSAAALFWSAMTGYVKAPYTVEHDDAADRLRRQYFEFGMRRIVDSLDLYARTLPDRSPRPRS